MRFSAESKRCEAVRVRVRYLKLVWTVAGAQGQDRLHSSHSRGVQFGDGVRNKNYLGRGQLQFISDPPITIRLNLVADGGVEVTRNVIGQVARRRAAEQQFLRQHAARGVDADELVLPAPSLKRRTHIVEDLAEQLSRKI